MLTLTRNALQTLASAFPDHAALRLDIAPRGCGAPVVSISPGPSAPHDLCIEAGGKKLCMDQDLALKVKAVLLDSCNNRFTVVMENPLKVSGCGDCPGSPLQGGGCGVLENANF